MAASHEMVAPQVAMIKQFIANSPSAAVVLTTNKRMIIRFNNREPAKQLALRITNNGLGAAVKKGLRTTKYYVQAIL